MSDLLKTMCYIADLNASDAKSRALSRSSVVTTADLENQEWQSFLAKLDRRKAQLGDVDVEEEEADNLIFVLQLLKKSKQPMTVSEITRALQSCDVLTSEFTAAARALTTSMLEKLRGVNRAWADPHGRWSAL